MAQAKTSPADRATERVRKRYNGVAPIYDFMESLGGKSFVQWRQLAWSKVEGVRILEVGVGTGKNFPYYPAGIEVIAIELSEKMLARARQKAVRDKVKVELRQMDVQRLEFPDNSFDTVIATCVFCSVPNPVQGFMEIRRVCKPGGKVVLLEHVISANRLLAFMMNLFNPLAVRMMGENMNRRTVENVAKSGLMVENVTNLSSIFRLIEARKGT